MLILARKKKQSIIIDVGDGVEIQIASIEGDTVKLAINAPREIAIHRKEIFDSIKESNKEAAHASGKTKLPQGALAAAKKKLSS